MTSAKKVKIYVFISFHFLCLQMLGFNYFSFLTDIFCGFVLGGGGGRGGCPGTMKVTRATSKKISFGNHKPHNAYGKNYLNYSGQRNFRNLKDNI